MTTTIKVTSHNYPALVEVFDNGNKSHYQVILAEDGEQTFYCTTTRQLRITDLEYEDPAVLLAKAKRAE
jgi:hypothetical protein